MNVEPLLSVCIAVGPGEDWQPLLSTLDSVLAQHGGGVEVVVKSAGQHLAPALRAHADAAPAGTMQLLFGADAGIYDAFNISVAAARGRYVMFLGCGDALAGPHVASLIAERAETAAVLYGRVRLEFSAARAREDFDNRCFFGERRLLPWRNPCHHQGLIYSREWLAQRPFRTDIGPLADLVHNYQYRVFDIARWIDGPISVFQQGGASTQPDWAAAKQRARAVLVNCNHFAMPPLWKAASIAILTTRYLAERMRPT